MARHSQTGGRSSHSQSRRRLLEAGIVGVILRHPLFNAAAGAVIGTFFAELGISAVKDIVIEQEDEYGSREYFKFAFASALQPSNFVCKVGNAWPGFKFDDDATEFGACFPQDDLAAQRAIFGAIGATFREMPCDDLKAYSMNTGDLLAVGGRHVNTDLSAIFQSLRDTTLDAPEIGLRIEFERMFYPHQGRGFARPCRILGGKSFSENPVIVLRRDMSVQVCELDSQHHPTNGFLIISKFPHPLRPGHKIIHVAGDTGAATEATKLLFTGAFIRKAYAEKFMQLMLKPDPCQATFIVSGLIYDRKLQRHMFTKIEPDGDPVKLRMWEIPKSPRSA